MLIEINKLKYVRLFLIIIGTTILIVNFVCKKCTNNIEMKRINNYINNNPSKNIIEMSKRENGYNYLLVLKINKINLNKGIYNISSNNNNVNKNIEIMSYSDLPDTNNGNVILAGHNGNSKVSFFRNLEKLNINDEIDIYYNHLLYKYKINNIYEIDKTGLAIINRDKLKNTLTLITCNRHKKNKQTIYVSYLDSINEY